MMSRKNDVVRKILIIIGVCLLAAAIVLLFAWQWNIHTSEQKVKKYVNVIRELIPEPQGAVPEERRDNTMSTLSIDGTDFVGILEFPRFESDIPVCADWGKLSKYPCRFSGSVYDGSMQIGGTSQKGQYDFYREISVGDHLYFTDMEGNRINPSEDIVIRDHVWIGNRVIVTKGVQIAENTIVGTGAIVTKSITEGNCAIAGVPAKIVKQNILNFC